MIFEFDGFKPVIDKTSYIHPQANVTGNVIIGKDVYVGPGAVIRGDWGKIIIEDGCNVQENCVIHMFGHGCIVHGAEIGENSLIGMNAVVMDNAVIGKETIIGALTMVPSKMVIPQRKIAVGNPAKIIKDVSDEMVKWKSKGTELYQQLPSDCKESLLECEPLSKMEKNRKSQEEKFKIWKDS